MAALCLSPPRDPAWAPAWASACAPHGLRAQDGTHTAPERADVRQRGLALPDPGALPWGRDVRGGPRGVCLGCGGSWHLPCRPFGPPAGARRACSCSWPTTTSCASWTRASSPLPGTSGRFSTGRAGGVSLNSPDSTPGPFLRLRLLTVGTPPSLTQPTGMTRSRGSRPSSGPWPSRRAVCFSTSGPSTPRSGLARTAPAPRAPGAPSRPFRELLVRAAQASHPTATVRVHVCAHLGSELGWGRWDGPQCEGITPSWGMRGSGGAARPPCPPAVSAPPQGPSAS